MHTSLLIVIDVFIDFFDYYAHRDGHAYATEVAICLCLKCINSIEIFHQGTKEQAINGYWNIVFTLYAQTLIHFIGNSLHLQWEHTQYLYVNIQFASLLPVAQSHSFTKTLQFKVSNIFIAIDKHSPRQAFYMHFLRFCVIVVVFIFLFCFVFKCKLKFVRPMPLTINMTNMQLNSN